MLSFLKWAGILISLTFALFVMAMPSGPQQPYDSCKPSEADIRSFWVMAVTSTTPGASQAQRDAERTAIAAQTATAVWDDCLKEKNKPKGHVPLPPELQRLVR